LIKNAAGVGLDGVFADEKLFGDFAVAHALGDEFEDFQFSRSDTEGFSPLVIGEEGLGGGRRDRNLFYDDALRAAGELAAGPNAESCEGGSDQADVDLYGIVDDQEVVFGPFEDGDEDSADQAIEKDVAPHGFGGIVLKPEKGGRWGGIRMAMRE